MAVQYCTVFVVGQLLGLGGIRYELKNLLLIAVLYSYRSLLTMDDSVISNAHTENVSLIISNGNCLFNIIRRYQII